MKIKQCLACNTPFIGQKKLCTDCRNKKKIHKAIATHDTPFTTSQIANITDLTHRVVYEELDRLHLYGYLKATGKKRARQWIRNKSFSELLDGAEN